MTATRLPAAIITAAVGIFFGVPAYSGSTIRELETVGVAWLFEAGLCGPLN